MDLPKLRRTGALLASAAMLASLMVATIVAPASAALTCDGLAATITDNDGTDTDPTVGFIGGTNGPDVIVGTADSDVINGYGGRDHICGGLGGDFIFGGDGHDRLFGGSGDDWMAGEGGRDDLFGFTGDDHLWGGDSPASLGVGAPDKKDFLKGGAGDDVLKGQRGDDVLKGNGGNDELKGGPGDDNLDGGPADDDCRQGSGSGPIKHCETADLRVTIIGPASPAHEGLNTFKVKVKNLGPQAATYSLEVGEDNRHANCDGPWEDVVKEFAELRPGSTRTRTYQVDCEIEDPDSWVQIFAEVYNDARDPRPGNNDDHTRRIDIQ
jgi:hypothetical protein